MLLALAMTVQIIGTQFSVADAAKGPDVLSEVHERYANGGNIQIDVKKDLKLSVLKKKKTSKGKLYLSGSGKFRLEITEPSRSLIVMDGKDVWVVDYPDFEDTKVQVLHSKYKDQIRSQVLLKFLMGDGDFMKHFKISKKEHKKNMITYTLTPKGSVVDLKTVKVVVDPADKIISSIAYTDSLENETIYAFENEKVLQSVDKKLFTFKPPKNAEVSEMN